MQISGCLTALRHRGNLRKVRNPASGVDQNCSRASESIMVARGRGTARKRGGASSSSTSTASASKPKAGGKTKVADEEQSSSVKKRDKTAPRQIEKSTVGAAEGGSNDFDEEGKAVLQETGDPGGNDEEIIEGDMDIPFDTDDFCFKVIDQVSEGEDEHAAEVGEDDIGYNEESQAQTIEAVDVSDAVGLENEDFADLFDEGMVQELEGDGCDAEYDLVTHTDPEGDDDANAMDSDVNWIVMSKATDPEVENISGRGLMEERGQSEKTTTETEDCKEKVEENLLDDSDNQGIRKKRSDSEVAKFHTCIPLAYSGPAFDENSYQFRVSVFPVGHFDLLSPVMSEVLSRAGMVRFLRGPSKHGKRLEVYTQRLKGILSGILFTTYCGNWMTIKVERRKCAAIAVPDHFEPNAFGEVINQVTFRERNAYARRTLKQPQTRNPCESLEHRTLFIDNVPASMDQPFLKMLFPRGLHVDISSESNETRCAKVHMSSKQVVYDHLISFSDFCMDGTAVKLRMADKTQEEVLRENQPNYRVKASAKSEKSEASNKDVTESEKMEEGKGQSKESKAKSDGNKDGKKSASDQKDNMSDEKPSTGKGERDENREDTSKATRMVSEKERLEKQKKDMKQRERAHTVSEMEQDLQKKRVEAIKPRQVTGENRSKKETKTNWRKEREKRVFAWKQRERPSEENLYQKMRTLHGERQKADREREFHFHRRLQTEMQMQREMEIQRELELQKELELQRKMERVRQEQDIERWKQERIRQEQIQEQERRLAREKDFIRQEQMQEQERRLAREKDFIREREWYMSDRGDVGQQQEHSMGRMQKHEGVEQRRQQKRMGRKRRRKDAQQHNLEESELFARKRGRRDGSQWQREDEHFHIPVNDRPSDESYHEQMEQRNPNSLHRAVHTRHSSNEDTLKRTLKMEVARQAEELKKNLALLDKIQKEPIAALSLMGVGGAKSGEDAGLGGHQSGAFDMPQHSSTFDMPQKSDYQQPYNEMMTQESSYQHTGQEVFYQQPFIKDGSQQHHGHQSRPENRDTLFHGTHQDRKGQQNTDYSSGHQRDYNQYGDQGRPHTATSGDMHRTVSDWPDIQPYPDRNRGRVDDTYGADNQKTYGTEHQRYPEHSQDFGYGTQGHKEYGGRQDGQQQFSGWQQDQFQVGDGQHSQLQHYDSQWQYGNRQDNWMQHSDKQEDRPHFGGGQQDAGWQQGHPQHSDRYENQQQYGGQGQDPQHYSGRQPGLLQHGGRSLPRSRDTY